MKCFFITSFFCASVLLANSPASETRENPTIQQQNQDLHVDLQNPRYKDGVLYTEEGGIVKNADIRFQAKKIAYTRKEGSHVIEAEGDLLIRYKERIFVGKKIFYDFSSSTGIIYDGTTYSSPWFLHGEKICLKKDGTYTINNVYITTCEDADSPWDIHAKSVVVTKTNQVETNNVRFRFFKIPALWLPSIKLNLKKKLTKPLFTYKVGWDKSGPKGSIRYMVYSYNDFSLYGRVDFHLRRGFGGAIETEYKPKNSNTLFETKSYLATDTLPNDPKNKRRYRLQGAYHTLSADGKTKADLTWDKYSDIHMPGDFKSEDFEINTGKETKLFFRHEEPDVLTLVTANPKVNYFETINQNIPTIFVHLRPINLPLGMILSNYAKSSYLSFSYAHNLKSYLSDYSAIRVEANQELIRPILTSVATITPRVGAKELIYSKNPHVDGARALGTIFYGLRTETHLIKNFHEKRHILTPYLQIDAYTNPTLTQNKHYTFSIQDGFHQIFLFQPGLKSQLYFSNDRSLFETNLYANTFFIEKKFPQAIPKIYFDLIWKLPEFYLTTHNCWNYQKQLIDFSNIILGWTLSDNLAFSVEFRHRSKYDWRKCDHENFILDVTRSESELLLSPLSDRRNTILTRAFVRLNAYWSCELESHHGWNRPHEPHYNEWKMTFFTFFNCLKVHFSYEHTQTNDKILGLGVDLIKY